MGSPRASHDWLDKARRDNSTLAEILVNFDFAVENVDGSRTLLCSKAPVVLLLRKDATASSSAFRIPTNDLLETNLAMFASLLTAVDSISHIHLVVGSDQLASSRCAKSLEVGARPIIIAPETADVHYGLQRRFDSGEARWLKKGFAEEDLMSLGREEVGGCVDAVFVTLGPRDPMSAHISDLCRRHRVPVNVADAPQLCSFTLLSTHTDGPLQIGITTNGKGCKLASRIRREISSTLPPNLGAACARLGTIRRRIQIEDHLTHLQPSYDLEEDESLDQSSSFNRLVTEADFDAAKNRRIRWLSQICEYWPLDRLAAISDTDVEDILNAYKAGLTTSPSPPESSIPSLLSEKARKGRVILAGSGPGHPDLLTHATLKAILTADLVLADKLVPSRVLDLIPRRTPVQIARKFPGNADQAQEELLALGLAGAKAGKTVLRLKQGDPYIYGRGGEEFEFFCKEGFGDRISVLPGITSALSAPLFAGIPPTQRGISDQILICTGTGRRGAPSVPPEYVPTRTVVFLMALHRISSLVEDLTTYSPEEQTWKERRSSPGGGDQKLGNGAFKRTLWPTLMPCAVIERASCPDQRVIRSTLAFIAAAIEEEGSRPPGLLVIGNACETLTRLDVSKKWIIEEGFRGLED